MMYTYPVLECLVVFAVVFLIGYLVGNSGGREITVAHGKAMARA